MKRFQRLPVLILAIVTFLSFGAISTRAAPVTIGQLPPSVPVPGCANGPADVVSLTVAAGSDYVVPSGYTEITSWGTYASEGVGQILALKVFHPFGGLKYEVVAEDAQELAPEQINSFPVDIHVAEGDVVGLDTGNALAVSNACGFLTNNPADSFGFHLPGVFPGETETFVTTEKDVRVNVRVTISAPPVLNFVSPPSGPVSGGTSVVIAGHDFNGAKAVRFGKAPAARFIVNSDNAITTVTPPSASAGTVDVFVTSAAGTTAVVSADRFTYVPVAPPTSTQPPTSTRPSNCVVPKLKGRSLEADRKRLGKAGCKLGKVRGHKSRSAKVTKQSAEPGTVLPPGGKVNVKIG
jgi:hypothetical protein